MRRHGVVVAALGVAALSVLPADAPADVTPPPAARNRLELRGADAMVPPMQMLAESYMTAHPEAKVMVAGHFADRGVKALIVGVADMAMGIDGVRDDTEALAESLGVKLRRTCVFRDAVVPVVAPENAVRDISLPQLRDVFRGAIQNWKEIGGADAPITVITQEVTSGAYEVWKKEVLGEGAVLAARAVVATEDEYYGKITGNAISFSGVNYVKSLRALTVNGIGASVDTISSGAYPILRQSCLYQRDPGTPLGNSFIDFIFSPAARDAIAKQKLVPVPRDK